MHPVELLISEGPTSDSDQMMAPVGGGSLWGMMLRLSFSSSSSFRRIYFVFSITSGIIYIEVTCSSDFPRFQASTLQERLYLAYIAQSSIKHYQVTATDVMCPKNYSSLRFIPTIKIHPHHFRKSLLKFQSNYGSPILCGKENTLEPPLCLNQSQIKGSFG